MSMPAGPDRSERDELQFDVAEPTPGAASAATVVGAVACEGCGRQVDSSYFTVGNRIACADCVAKINAPPAGSRTARLGRSTVYGIAAAILGAIIWYAIREITRLEIGYVAILVGFMVGGAVFKGSGKRGGLAYQFLAIVLTYCSIAGNYAPDVVSALLTEVHRSHPTTAQPRTPAEAATDAGVVTAHAATRKADDAAAKVSQTIDPKPEPDDKPPVTLVRAVLALGLLILLVAGITLAAPFLGGLQNAIGLLIIGFALLQAWRMNRARRLPISGPFQIGQRRPGSAI